MNLPIDVVVELLVRNYRRLGSGDSADVCVYPIQGPPITAWLPVHLVPKLREYLLTLVPKPKPLSECEEGKWFLTPNNTPVIRKGDRVYLGRQDMVPDPVLRASAFQVIQPVEVQ